MPKVIRTQPVFCHDAPLQCKAALAGDVLLDWLCLCWLVVLVQVIVICACAGARLGRYVCELVELFVHMYVLSGWVSCACTCGDWLAGCAHGAWLGWLSECVRVGYSVSWACQPALPTRTHTLTISVPLVSHFHKSWTSMTVMETEAYGPGQSGSWRLLTLCQTHLW